MSKILDGKNLSQELAIELATEISKGVFSTGVKPKLVIVQVGDLEESNTYIRNKKLFAEKIGVEVVHKIYNENVTENKVVTDIALYNADTSIHGIIVQLPIPSHLNTNTVIEAINPKKDVDGMTSQNVKLLYENQEGFMPATTKGIILLLEKYNINLDGKKVVIVGNSVLVGKPTALAMLNRGATVTVCHARTKNLKEETKTADILIVAAGVPKLVSRDHVSKGQIVIDIGINVIAVTTGEKTDKKIVGDVDFEEVKDIVEAITPVPGGVGPMTIVSLFQNLMKSTWQVDLPG